MRSPSPSPLRRAVNQESLSRNTSLETRSRSPSPNPVPVATSPYEYYGTANLTDRSRSPSPTSSISEEGTRLLSRRQPTTPQKPAALNLSARRIDSNMPHVLPSPTIPQPHKSPGSINFPRLSASPSHGFYDVNWTHPRGQAPRSHASNLPRSVSSQQLGRTRNVSTMCIDRNRSRYPSQILHPHPNTCQRVLLLPSGAHGSPQRPVNHQVEMDDIILRRAADAFGFRSVGQSSSTLPRTCRKGRVPTQDEDWSIVGGPNKTDGALYKEKQTEVHSDSEDEDWC